jgi:hypothetical protein
MLYSGSCEGIVIESLCLPPSARHSPIHDKLLVPTFPPLLYT